jgi:hypothetical protein
VIKSAQHRRRRGLVQQIERRQLVPKVSRDSAANVQDNPMVDARSDEIAGYRVDLVTIRQTHDLAAMLKGLPDDRCPCPHWGYVLKGRLTWRFADGEEIYEAGDAFYVPPGHVPEAEAGSEFVQFSPADQFREVAEAMGRNMQAMGAA